MQSKNSNIPKCTCIYFIVPVGKFRIVLEKVNTKECCRGTSRLDTRDARDSSYGKNSNLLHYLQKQRYHKSYSPVLRMKSI